MSNNDTSLAEEIKQAVDDLAKDSEHIHELVSAGVAGADVLKAEVEQIQDIAKQVNKIMAKAKIISLNAKIEAGRAGQAGAGFGVVASEMESLTRTVNETAESIKAHANNVMQMANGAKERYAIIAEATESQLAATQEIVASLDEVLK